MLESLGRIENPLLRSITAAITVGSAVTMAAAIALGVTKAKDNAAYQAALSAALLGVGGGAIFGLAYSTNNSKSTLLQTAKESETSDRQTWKDWRSFVVVRKVKESEEITSFYLKPEDGEALPNFQPGQFLTIKLDIPGQTKPVIRTYSLSDYAEPCEYYRLSIKREPMPAGSNFMPGIASNFMHDRIHEGSVISTKPPSGKFVLNPHRSLPAVLVSNGVGITPMISMAKAVTQLNSARPIWFVHGTRDSKFHAFRDEIVALAQQNFNLRTHFVYSRPQPEDSGHYDSTGYVDTSLVRSIVQQEAEYFLCGSPAFLQSLRTGLEAAGVPEHQIFFEMFTKGSFTTTEAKSSAARLHEVVDRTEVVFTESGKTAIWQTGSGNLLEFAEANDLDPPYSCRQGICGTCACKILEGEVEYQETPVAAIDEGSILICISRPKTTRIVLDL